MRLSSFLVLVTASFAHAQSITVPTVVTSLLATTGTATATDVQATGLGGTCSEAVEAYVTASANF